MNEFNALRQAKDQRDAAIAQAKQEFKLTLKQIDTLERSIAGGTAKRGRRASVPNDVSLRQAVADVLGARKMTSMEIAVGVLQSGYKTISPRSEVKKRINAILRTDARFKREGERWHAV